MLRCRIWLAARASSMKRCTDSESSAWIFVQDLDRGAPLQQRMLGLVDRAEPAGAQLALNAILPGQTSQQRIARFLRLFPWPRRCHARAMIVPPKQARKANRSAGVKCFAARDCAERRAASAPRETPAGNSHEIRLTWITVSACTRSRTAPRGTCGSGDSSVVASVVASVVTSVVASVARRALGQRAASVFGRRVVAAARGCGARRACAQGFVAAAVAVAASVGAVA